MLSENNEELPKPILIKNLGMIFPTESRRRKLGMGYISVVFVGQNLELLLIM
jgi:hypothetical protein